MRIALDAMGGDKAPEPIVEGAVQAARELGLDIVLVGREEAISAQVAESGQQARLEIVHAPEVIEMDDHPAMAIRRKKNSSMLVGMRLIKDGRADAFVSAGNSGAVMAGALMVLGRCSGISRPAISALLPTLTGHSLLIDAGANTDVHPDNLVQFARMGSIYMSAVMGIHSPKVGLLSNGEEETKGTALTLESYPLLRDSGLNFIGNVEGRDITRGEVDVIATDGFTGNIALKAMEGASELILSILREEITRGVRDKLGALALMPAFRRIRSRLDPSEFGGAPLLGINGVVLIAHGRSDAKAIRNALRLARDAAQQDIVSAINRTAKVEAPATETQT